MKIFKLIPVLFFSFGFSQQKSDADLFSAMTAKELNNQKLFSKIDTTKKKKDSVFIINKTKNKKITKSLKKSL